MTRASTEQYKHTPWFAKAGAACSIVPIARFVGPNIFALKGGGYGCLFSLTGIDEEGLIDQELDSQVRSIEGALRGLPEGSCLYQYTRVMSGFDLPRQAKYTNQVTEVFASTRLTFLEQAASFRRIDLHWCLTIEPSKVNAFERKPAEHNIDTSRLLAELEKTATLLQGHLGSSLGLRPLAKKEAFQFFSYLFNLEDWAEQDQLRGDEGVDRQIVKNPVAWHSDHLQVGKRQVQMFSLKTTPEASRPCLFSGLLTLDCDGVLCSSWRVKPTSAARSEIDSQEKFISFFKVGVLTRVMSGRDTASLETGAGAKAANNSVDELSEVIRSLDKKAQGEYSLRLLLVARSHQQLRNTIPAVHRVTTKEPSAGEWVSKFIGKVEVERLRETHFDGTRAGRNFSLDRQVEPLVLESEISGLADLHAYMKYQNYVTRFSFPYFDMPEIAKGFELRERADDKLPYDPKKMRETEASPAELKQEPEASIPAQAEELATAHQIEPETVILPDTDEQQNLILRG